MFTGIVEEMGAVKALARSVAGVRLSILASTIMDDLAVGASVSVNGACLTVADRGERDFAVDVSTETLGVTTLGTLAPGAPVNLERAMKVQQRLGGHLVAGHVDGVGALRSRKQEGNTLLLTIDAPSDGPAVFLPSKLVEYLIFRKPILGLTPECGASADLLRRAGCPIAPPDDEAAIAATVQGLLHRAAAGTLCVSEAFDSVAEEFDIRRTTGRLHQILVHAFERRAQ